MWPAPTARSAPASRCGRPRDRRAHSCINGCRTGNNSLHGLPFPRLASYGVIANLLAMPIVSVWVMPMGLLGLIAIRGRAVAARHWRTCRAVSSENAAALERRRPGRHRQRYRDPHTPCRMCSFPPTGRHSRFGAPTDGYRSTELAATPLPSRSGSPPMATRGCPTIRPWGRVSAATRPAAL